MSDTASLYDIIAWLEQCPPDALVTFSDGKCPGAFDSWRGVYSQLALGRDGSHPVPALVLLKAARDCIGQTFTGYKGGKYWMSQHSEVWADNWGECTDTRIVGGRCRGLAAELIVISPEAFVWEVVP